MRTRTLLYTFAACIALATAAAAETHADFNKDFDFSTLRTFEFKAQRRYSRDPIADNAIWSEEIRNAIRSNLGEHGLVEQEGAPDFFVAYYVGLKDRYDVRYIDYGFPYWHHGFRGFWGWPNGYDAWAVPYTESTLIIDIIDARSNQLVWRGWDKDSINLGKTEKEFGKAVENVLKKFYHDRDKALS